MHRPVNQKYEFTIHILVDAMGHPGELLPAVLASLRSTLQGILSLQFISDALVAVLYNFWKNNQYMLTEYDCALQKIFLGKTGVYSWMQARGTIRDDWLQV